MITKIDKIVDFGNFKNFDWNIIPEIEDFKEKNIFYGWNYSGKTTLSRLFSSLRDRAIHPDYKNANFRISFDLGIVDNTTLSTFPYQVEVFNSDYIRENLRWEYDEDINAIFFEVGDNAKISDKILNITNLIDLINGTEIIKGKKEIHQKAIEEYNNFENQFTIEARNIKNDSFLSLIEFNKSHLKKIKDTISYDLDKYIIKSKDELDAISQVVKIKEPKARLNTVVLNSNFPQIISHTKDLLSSVPSKSEIIQILDEKKDAYEWTKTGLSFHKKGDNCIFCGNKIDNNRLDSLISYFANQASKLKEKIKEILKIISEEEELINSLVIPYSLNDFNDNFQNDYKKRIIEFDKGIKMYLILLKKIKHSLTQKINEFLYSELSFTYDENDINSLLESVNQINAIIVQNNKFVDNFDSIIIKERDKYKNHLVAVFLKEAKYLSKEKKYGNAAVQLKKLDEKVQIYQKEISRLNSLKESDSEGCAQFNSFVQSFLSRDDIEIKLNKLTKKFNLMRGTELAQNLSEGEKMAISFSHFFVYLKSIEKKGQLKDHIIFIDDPISSLDSNHIFQINSLLKEMFFDKIPNPDIKQKELIWGLKCKQLFISTHNFEFFNLLKELPKHDGFGKKGNKESKYFITRNISESSIEKLPNVYTSSSSEYQYLFSEIIDFYNCANKGSFPKLLMMPNIIRRFVEMYTLTKYPKNNEEVDARAEIVFGKRESKRILKLLHYFSHFNNIDRINKHSELVADIEPVCNDIIQHLKTKDKIHFDALEASLN
jgi:wobble nucleotide-excising tRNase